MLNHDIPPHKLSMLHHPPKKILTPAFYIFLAIEEKPWACFLHLAKVVEHLFNVTVFSCSIQFSTMVVYGFTCVKDNQV